MSTLTTVPAVSPQTALPAPLPKSKQEHSTVARLVAQFSEHRIAAVSASVLLLMMCVALFAPLFVAALGVSPEQQNIEKRYQPALTVATAPLDVQEQAVEQHLRNNPAFAATFAQQLRSAGLVSNVEQNDEDTVFAGFEKMADAEGASQIEKIGTAEAAALAGLKASFTARHLLGTDELGRDVLARLIYGARISLFVALFTGISAAFIGLFVGSLAGYYGGIVDALLMRLTDALLALPVTPLLIVLAAVDLKKIPGVGALLELFGRDSESITKMIFILAMFAWMPMARLVRGSVLSIRENEFVLAARTIGASDLRIICLHLVPNILGPLLVAVTLATGENMLFESALSFLGLGIQPPTPSWGNMLHNALELVNSAPLLAVLPGLMIFVVVIAVNFVGDGMRDALDPKSVKR